MWSFVCNKSIRNSRANTFCNSPLILLPSGKHLSDLSQALLRLEAKDGDIVFFDLGSIAIEALAKVCNAPGLNLTGVVFIGICVRHGQSVEDAVFAMSKTELELLMSDKGNDA